MPVDNEPAAGFAERFFRYFQHEVTALQEQMDSLVNTSLVGGERDDAVDHCLAGIARLSQEVNDASKHLPAYDQRTYSQAVKALTSKLNSVRSSFAPRPKFTFKSALKTRSPQAKHATPVSSNNTNSIDGALDIAAEELNKHIRSSSSPSQIHQPSFESSAILSLSQQQHAYIQPRAPERGRAGRSAKLTDLSSCVIDLRSASADAPFAGVTLRNVNNSLVVCGRVEGPVHGTGLKGVVLVVSARQIRLHEAADTKVYAHCASRVVVEDVKGVGVAPLPRVLTTDALEGVENRWSEVDDFKWLKAEASPNWAVIWEEDRFGDDVWKHLTSPKEGTGNITEDTLKAFGISC